MTQAAVTTTTPAAPARLTPDQEAIELGYLAASCDLWAWQESGRERERLLQRAARYRDLQLAAMIEAQQATGQEVG